MSSQNNDGIEYTIEDTNAPKEPEAPVEQPIPKGNCLHLLTFQMPI